MRIFRRVIPVVLAVSLLAGCSFGGRVDNLVSEVQKTLKQEITSGQKPMPVDGENINPVKKKETETQVKTPEKPKTTTARTEKKQTTTTTTKTTPPVVTNNGRPDIKTNYSFEYLKAVEDEIVALCNQERAKAGKGPLVINETLRLSARYKSNEMLQHNYFEHKSPITGFNAWDIAKTYGYKYTAFGENLYMVQGLAKARIEASKIFEAWMNSSGHRANILNGNFGKIGVGVVFSSVNNKCEATQHFSN